MSTNILDEAKATYASSLIAKEELRADLVLVLSDVSHAVGFIRGMLDVMEISAEHSEAVTEPSVLKRLEQSRSDLLGVLGGLS